MGSDDIDELVAQWLALRDEGHAPAPSEFAARHPEHRAGLCDAIERLVETEQLIPRRSQMPERVGRWRISRLIGAGGAGVVFEGVDNGDPGRRAAVKLLAPALASDPRALSRLKREARVLMQDPHPNVVRVLEVETDAAIPWLAMELIEGPSLKEVLDRARSRLPDPASGPACGLLDLPGAGGSYHRVARCGAELAKALRWAHAHGLVHRDLKPANVVLRPDGSVVLLDFGLAADSTATALTQTGDVLGTPAYMAPEQARGARAGPEADLYGLGAILYEMVTLRPPFEGPDASSVLRKVRTSLCPRVRAIDPGVPPPLAAVIERAMAPRPSARPSGADAVAADLERFLGGESVEARSPTALSRIAWRVAARPVMLLAVVGGVLLVGCAILSLMHASAERRREAALSRAVDRAALILVEPLGNQGLDGAAREIAALDRSPALSNLLSDIAAGRVPAATGDADVARLAVAEQALAQGDRRRARALLEEAVAASPGSPVGWALLSRLARDDAERSRLAALIAKAGERAPDSAALHAGLGHVLTAERDHSGAAAAFARARGAARESGHLAYHHACALDRAGRRSEAVAAAREGGSRDLIRLGRYLDRARRREEAWAVFREVLAAEPDRVDARFHLGNSLSSAELVEPAAHEFREILAREPRHAPSLISLAWLHAWICGHAQCASLHDPDRAIELAGAAVRADGGRERAILVTATRIARHLDRRDAMRAIVGEVIRQPGRTGSEVGLLEDAIRELSDAPASR